MTVAFNLDDPAVHYNGRWRVAPMFVLALLGGAVVLIIVGVKKPSARGQPVEPVSSRNI